MLKSTFLNRLLRSFNAFSTMNSHHLKKGSPLPPFNGKLRLYNMRFCPYAQRTILALNAKKVPYEVINIHLHDKPEWLTSKSPLGKVPALEIKDGVVIYESLVTADYVDEAFPGVQLASKDPLRKAQDKLIVENFNKTIRAYYKVIFDKEPITPEFFEGFDMVQANLSERGTSFLSGNSPGMVDYMIWPWIERVDLLPIYAGDQCKLDTQKYKTLLKWIAAMKEDPAVKEYYLDTETHKRFIDERMVGVPNYDMLVK